MVYLITTIKVVLIFYKWVHLTQQVDAIAYSVHNSVTLLVFFMHIVAQVLIGLIKTITISKRLELDIWKMLRD